jgi:hypothetical protein
MDSIILNHPLVEHRKRCKQQFRRVYRTEIAMRDLCLKEKVMNIRTKDSKIFHMLINRQRQSIRGLEPLFLNIGVNNPVFSRSGICPSLVIATMILCIIYKSSSPPLRYQ